MFPISEELGDRTMEESTKALHSLKVAANYSKLGMHKFGPRSFKKGQGALLKAIYKFGREGSLDKKPAERVLDWRGKDLREVARKAEKNGYIKISHPKYEFKMTLTENGTKVVEKRLTAEDHAADMIFESLTGDEKQQLIALCDKVSENCKKLGVDYSLIEKR